MSKHKRPDWTKLPKSLSTMQGASEKYGIYQYDERIRKYLLNDMRPGEREELKLLSIFIESHTDEIQAYLDKYNMTKHTESELIYFTLCLISIALDLELLK